MHRPNNLLEFDVQDALAWDPVVDESRIVVKADEGRVTLTGTVPTFYDTSLAVADAWSVLGVVDVEDELLVGLVGGVITDADMAAACIAALDADKFVPNGSVTPTVNNGWVTLTGQVRHHHQRQAAEHAIRRIDGVLGISDNIELSSEPIPSDVADRITNAFRRNAIIDDSLIEVTNSDHTIYLDGTVGSYAALQEAVDTAWQAPGVTYVIDRLIVIP